MITMFLCITIVTRMIIMMNMMKTTMIQQNTHALGALLGCPKLASQSSGPNCWKQLGHRHPDTVPWRPNVGYEPQIRVISGFHIPSGYD